VVLLVLTLPRRSKLSFTHLSYLVNHANARTELILWARLDSSRLLFLLPMRSKYLTKSVIPLTLLSLMICGRPVVLPSPTMMPTARLVALPCKMCLPTLPNVSVNSPRLPSTSTLAVRLATIARPVFLTLRMGPLMFMCTGMRFLAGHAVMCRWLIWNSCQFAIQQCLSPSKATRI
jgi:hypothetical protein